MTAVVNVADMRPECAQYFEELTASARVMFAWNGRGEHLGVTSLFRSLLAYASALGRIKSELVIPAHGAFGEIQRIADVRWLKEVIVCPTIRFLPSFVLIEDAAILRGFAFGDDGSSGPMRPYAVSHVWRTLRVC